VAKSTTSARYRYFRELLQEARIGQEMSQRDLAKRLKQPQSFISRYETGVRRIDPVEFLDIAEALSIDPYALLKQVAARPKAKKQ
jgi:transcriptional regulator with XRE-family HTH domain